MKIKNFTKKIFIYIFAITLYGIFQITLADPNQGQLSLSIKAGFLTIIGTGNIDIGTINNQATTGEKIISTTNSFQIRDLRGSCSGHYTTIQMSNINNGTNYIPNDNIYFRVNSGNTIQGLDNSFSVFGPQIYNTRSTTKTPVTYIKRENNQGCYTIGRYGENGEIKINIPENQAAGNYRGKIYYLMIEN